MISFSFYFFLVSFYTTPTQSVVPENTGIFGVQDFFAMRTKKWHQNRQKVEATNN